MGGLRVFAVAVVMVTLLSIRGSALKAPLAENEEIGIDAEQISYDQKNSTIDARGAVVITRGTTVLRADEVHVNRSTNEADAIGNVSVTDPEGTIVANEMHFNLDEETGSLMEAQVQSRRLHYSLWGSRVEKGLGQSYHIENGRFTTCRCADGAPSWSISGAKVDVTIGGYATMRDGTFNVLDTPVLYLPRALFPVQRERQSGFLTPRFGVSNQRGFQTLLPFYWAIDKSQDATVALDVETSVRIGLVGEYRYALARGSDGVLNLSYFNEFFRGNPPVTSGETSVPENRWSVETEQTQQLTPGMHAYTDMLLVSDDLFLRQINTYAFDHAQDVAIRTLPFTTSRAGIVQLWDRAALKGEGTYYQNLTGVTPEGQPVTGAPSGETLQRAPEVSLWGQSLISGNLLGDLNAVGVDYQRGHGSDGVRLDVQPGLTLPLPLGPSLFGAVRASARETAYHLTNTTVVPPPPLNDMMVLSAPGTVPKNQSRELVQVDAEVGATLDRIYPVHWFGLEKLKHTIEPEIQYLYIPSVAQADLPFFDGADRVNRRNLLTYGVVSRFIGRFAPREADESHPKRDGQGDDAVRELGRLSITQSADITHEINTTDTGRAADHFSDIDIAGRVNPSRFLSARFLTNYDVTNTNIDATRVGLFVEDPRYTRSQDGPHVETRTSAGVSYRIQTQNNLQEIDENIVLRITDWAGALYSSRYDLAQNHFLDNFFGLRFLSTCDCWALDLAVVDRRNPQEVEVRAQVTLVGLGSSKKNSRVAAAP